MKRFLLLAALALMCTGAWAQRVIQGTVTSASDGSALEGVAVVVKGTTIGAYTNETGKFRLEAPADARVLSFMYVGMRTLDYPLSAGENVINVQLEEDALKLDEVVVVGYGTLQRKTITGSLSSVKGSEISTLVTPDFSAQLAGRAPGLQVTTVNGVIGTAPRIRIRGTNSISSGADPLIVIDNVPMITGNQSGVTPTNPLGDINPADIESVEVLKDGAATAIYGSRAANGVILITTKRGQAGDGKMSVNYDALIGTNTAISRLDLLDANQFITIANEKYTNAGQQPQALAGPNNINTDWQDVIFRNGFTQSHNLSFRGGNRSTQYYFSAGYMDMDGALVSNSMKRYNFRSSLDHRVNKFIKTGATLALTRTEMQGLNTGSNALSGNLVGASRLLPNVRVQDFNDPTLERFGYYNITADGAALGRDNNLRAVDNNFTNLAFVLANNLNNAYTNRVVSNGYIDVEPVEGLKLRSQIGVDLLQNKDFLSWDPRHGDGRGSNGIVFMQNRDVQLWNWQNTISYDKLIADAHQINAVAGVEYQQATFSNFSGQGSNFSDRFFIQQHMISGSFANQFAGGSLTPTGFDSYFGRINYGYKSRYLAGFSWRNDGLSSLPQGDHRGTFFGGSVGWRISQEDFWQNSDALSTISELKVRASYAEVGNSDIGAFPYAGLFGAAQYASLTGIAFSQVGNPDLRWETSKKLDIGVDIGLFKDRVGIQYDYFSNDIDGLILAAPVAPSLGIPGNVINKNIGSMRNWGHEFNVNAVAVDKKDFRWNLMANFTLQRNELVGLNKNAISGEDEDIILTYHINRVGEQIGTFYGFEWYGVNPENGNPVWVKGDGSLVQYDISANRHVVFDPANPADVSTAAALSATADRKLLGLSNPQWLGGLNSTWSWKGLSLETFFRFSGGNYIMNVTKQATLMNMGFQNNGAAILDRWTPENKSGTVPKVYVGREAAINNTGAADSRFLEKGDFLRLQNVILSYNLPASLVAKSGSAGIRSARLFAQIQNAFVMTPYTGLDPELNASNTTNSAFGVDDNANPIIRTVSFGLNLGF